MSPGKVRVPLCRHGHTICEKCIQISDASKRMADVINSLVSFLGPWGVAGKWIAVRLRDGGTDGVLYDTRADAIKHQIDERFCMYVCMTTVMEGAKPLDCAITLEYYRQAYDAGMRLHEPEAPQLIMPTAGYDYLTGRARNVRR
jgi:hypothetical protein